VTSSWFFLPTLNYDARSTTHQIHISMLLKSRSSLTCFRASFLPGRTKDLSAPR